MDTNQDPPRPVLRLVTADDTPTHADEAARLTEERRRRSDQVGGEVRQGLMRWLLLLAVCAGVSLATQHIEGPILMAIAALFVLTQSWDTRDAERTGDLYADQSVEPGDVGRFLRLVMPLIAPAAGALLYGGLWTYAKLLPATPQSIAAMQWSVAAALVCLLAAFPPIQQQLALVFTRGAHPGHTARLTASLALVVLLLPVPSVLLMPSFLAMLPASSKPLADTGMLVSQLAGEILFALAAVGLWVRRSPSEVRDRLGLGPLDARLLAVALLGLAAVLGVNAGMEWVERTSFPALWARDQDMVRMIAAGMSPAAMLTLGVSAGVGEELLVRGALQPRVGLVWASLLFAAGHVQYTWFGMLTILALGITLGLIRKHTNTTTAIVVHVLYDIVAALGASQS